MCDRHAISDIVGPGTAHLHLKVSYQIHVIYILSLVTQFCLRCLSELCTRAFCIYL